MPLAYWMAIATLVAAPVAVAAQEKSPPMAPSNPAAAASPFHYKSAFDGYQQMPQENETPDKVWRAVNDQMGSLGGHVGHIKAAADSKFTASESESTAVPRESERTPAGHESHGMDHTSKGN